VDQWDSNPSESGDITCIFLFFIKISRIGSGYLAYPDSLRVVLHFVHLKNVIVEWIVSSAASTVHVSLSVFPHFSQTT